MAEPYVASSAVSPVISWQACPHVAGHRSSVMKPLLVAAMAMAGLLIGWGLRVPVFRLAVRAGESQAASCPRCGHDGPRAVSLRWGAVPAVGRCPECHARAGPRPLVLEVVTALVLGGLAARVPAGLTLAAACWLGVCGVALAWIDASVQRLPDALTGAAYTGTAGLLLAAAVTSGNWHDLLRAAVAGLALAAALAAVAVISHSALGLGDAKLAASLGTLLAWFGGPTLVRGIVAGFLLGGVYGAALLVFRRATRAQQVAFGPFMLVGALLAILAT
jgi:leader peptidase (prepilin peptidase) / N-methyltransferase